MFDIDKELSGLEIQQQHPSERLRQKTRQLVMDEIRKKQQPKQTGRSAWFLTSAMAVLAALMIVFTLPPAADEVSYYTVDINPSISMQVNASQTVLEVSAENDDAVMLLKSITLEGLPIQKALAAYVKAADDQGYLKEQGHVLVARFGATTGLTQREIETVIGESTGREVKVLLLQSTKNEFERAKTTHSQAGIELLKKQAADKGIKEQDVDEIIDQMVGNKPNQQAGSAQDSPKNSQKPDNQPSPAAAQNNQSEKDNSGGAGNSENAHGNQAAASSHAKKEDKEVKPTDGNASGNAEDKPSDTSQDNNGDENKNEDADKNNDGQSSDKNIENKQKND